MYDIDTYTHTHISIVIKICTSTHIHTDKTVWVVAHVCVCMNHGTCIHVSFCMHVVCVCCVYACLCQWVHVWYRCMYTHTRTRAFVTHIYTRTHIHTDKTTWAVTHACVCANCGTGTHVSPLQVCCVRALCIVRLHQYADVRYRYIHTHTYCNTHIHMYTYPYRQDYMSDHSWVCL